MYTVSSPLPIQILRVIMVLVNDIPVMGSGEAGYVVAEYTNDGNVVA